MSDGLTAQEIAFFDRLDEMPQRRAGGRVISMEPAKRGKSEFPSRKGLARLTRARARLAELEARMKAEEL